MEHKITTVWENGMQFKSDNPSGKTIIMDTDIDDEKRKGVSPKAMMLSSLAGCSGLDVVSILNKMKVEIDEFKMEIKGELTDEHPKIYHTVTVDYHFYGENLNQEKIRKAVKLSAEKYCGVMEMFRKFSKININTFFH